MLARIGEELTRAARHGHPAALVPVAIEGCRSPGMRRDEAWRSAGTRCGVIRRMDIAGRFEGDSVLVLLPRRGAGEGGCEPTVRHLAGIGGAHHVRFTVRLGLGLIPITVARDANC